MESKKQISNPRNWVFIKKKESQYRLYVLLINKPHNKNKDEEVKPCEILIRIPLNNPLQFKLKIDTRDRFKCKIEEKAIIFFKSKYRKHENDATIIPIRVKQIINEDKNRKDKKNELKINLIIP